MNLTSLFKHNFTVCHIVKKEKKKTKQKQRKKGTRKKKHAQDILCKLAPQSNSNFYKISSINSEVTYVSILLSYKLKILQNFKMVSHRNLIDQDRSVINGN